MAKTLKKILALLLAAALLAGMIPTVFAADEREVVPLKEVYAGRFMIGTVMNPRDSGAKLEFIRTHFNALTPENNTKPDNIWNSPSGNPNYSQTDTMVSARKADGFYTIGHALAWHNQSSNWPSPGLTYEEARAQLERYISTIAGHFYADESIRFDAWDVVNEAMRDNPENPTDWRNALRHGDLPIERPAKWYAAYANGGNGWDYVYDAFLFARKYAPNALLNYNDFNDEEIPSKAIAIASMVTELNQRYAEEHPEDPRKLIESIGIQGHYSTRLNTDNLEQVLKIYAATGCRICVTELDVQCNGTVGRTLTEEQQREQAVVYAKLFMLYKKYDKFIDRVTFWGTDDSSNWRSSQRPMLFDVNRNPKEAYWAAIDPEGYLGLGKEAPRLDAISFGGQSLDCSLYDVDVSVPKDVSEVSFSAENVIHGYDPSQVQVTVEMEDIKVPCTATVKIAWADTPQSCSEYTVNFGHMTAEWLNDVNYPDTGYRSSVRIRFSDGETKYQLRQSFNSAGSELNTLAEIDPPAKNGTGVYWVHTPEQLDEDYLKSATLKKSLLDAEEKVIPARITSFTKPERYYRLADSIEPGKTYIIVSSATGKAFTHKALQPVPAGGNLTESKAGYEGTDVTVEDGIIVGPSLIQDNIRFIFLPRESPDAGEYSGGFNMLSLVHGGLIQPFIIWREDVSTPTAGLYSNATIGDADLDRAVWFNTGFDPETHETTLFLHSASKNLTYVLTGNENGFAAQGGSGSIDEYKSLGRVKLYEYVETFTEDTECEHDYKAVVTAPTCTEKGCTTHTCAKCGLSYTDGWVEALGHDWDDGVVTKPPTETASGVMTYTCRRCGETRTERIPRTGTGGWTLADTVEAGKQYVIVSNGYALTNKVTQVSTAYGGTSLASTPVTVDDGLITSEVSDEMIWDFAEGASAVAGEFTTGYFLTNGDSKYLSRNGPTNGNPAPLNTQTYDAENVATKPQWCYWIVRDLDEQGNKAVFLAATGEWSFALRGSAEGFDAPGNSNTDTVTAANPVQLYELAGSVVTPCEHDYQATVTPPTCTEAGYTTYTCSKCGDSYVAGEVPALGHDFKDGKCTRCGEADPNYVPPVPGSVSIDFTTAADAGKYEIVGKTADTLTEGVGLTLTATLQAIETAGTHWEEGYDMLSGEDANTPVDIIKIPVSGDWTATLDFGFDAGSSRGYYEFFGFYAMKGEDYQNLVGIRGADGDIQDFLRKDGAISAALNSAYIGETGMPGASEHWFRIDKTGNDYVCCGSTDGENFIEFFSFSATGINADYLIIDAYSSMETGYTYTLKSLDIVKKAETELCEHDYKSVVTAPTCTAKGYTTYTCAKCGDKYVGDEVEALGHDYQVAVTEPTCTRGGYSTNTCARCGDSYRDAETAALGHEFGEWAVTKAATCTEKGEETRTCARCDAKETRELAVLGHDYQTVVTAPTCTEAGYTAHTCARCGFSYNDSETAALGHDYRDGVCARCGEKDPDYVPPIEKAALQAAIAAAEKLDVSGYTDESVATFTKALNDAKAALEADSQAAVDKAAADLEAAVKALVEKEPFRFDDVKDESQYYFDPVYWAVDNGITTGATPTTFSPGAGCTRAQVVTFLWRAAGKPEPTKTDNPFHDVQPDAYYYKAVLWAVEKGITTGTSATTFRPDQTCTRGQIVTFLWRYNEQPEPTKMDNPFTDVPVDQYYYKAVLWAVEKGITKGTSADKFSPDSTCTRAQIVTFLYRAQA